MIEVKFFYDLLAERGTDFFSGVPDSLLKNFCAFVTDNAPEKNHIISANEGSAVALASGYHLATEKIPLVYMQNSGIGNAANPLLSLADSEVYSVPILLLVGWRGEPAFHDEVQHKKQGKVTLSLFSAMQIPFVIMSQNEAELKTQVDFAYETMKKTSAPFAFVVRKNTFSPYALKKNEIATGEITREDAIEKIILAAKGDAIFVSTTGMCSRELFELRQKHEMNHERDFLTVGSMGHASQIAFSISLQKPNRKIFCLDGDGAALMHLGGLATIGSRKPKNFIHIVLNNGAHDSVGGQPTVACKIDLCQIAKACGYEKVFRAKTDAELTDAVASSLHSENLTFIEVLVKKGARADLGRPTTTPKENKRAFMEFVGLKN